MKVVLAFGIFCLCGWSVHGASVSIDAGLGDPFLKDLNKKNDSVPADDSPEKRKIREEVYEEVRKMRDQQNIRDAERQKEQMEQQKRTAGSSPVVRPAAPVVQSNNPQFAQRTMYPNNQQTYQQPQAAYGQQPYGQQYGQPQAAAAPPPPDNSISPTQLLSSGILASILSPQMPQNQGGSLIPPLIGQGLKDSMEKQRATQELQQQQQQPRMMYNPMMDARQMYPQMNGLGMQQPYGMGMQQPYGQNTGIPNFGSATPTFGNAYPQTGQGYLPQASGMQPTMQQQVPLQNTFSNPTNGMMTGMGQVPNNGLLSNTNMMPQQQGMNGFQG